MHLVRRGQIQKPTQTLRGSSLKEPQCFKNKETLRIVEVDFLWNRTVDSLKTSFHALLWTSSGLRDS